MQKSEFHSCVMIYHCAYNSFLSLLLETVNTPGPVVHKAKRFPYNAIGGLRRKNQTDARTDQTRAVASAEFLITAEAAACSRWGILFLLKPPTLFNIETHRSTKNKKVQM
jgi:hypothetical protein